MSSRTSVAQCSLGTNRSPLLKLAITAIIYVATNGPAPSGATTMREASLDELVMQSQLVVVGHANTQRSHWQQGRILTTTEIEVQETWVNKTKAAPPDTLRVVTLGGRVGSIGQIVHGSPQFAPSERLVLCLAPIPSTKHQQLSGSSQASVYAPVALSQGVFRLPGTGAIPSTPAGRAKLAVKRSWPRAILLSSHGHQEAKKTHDLMLPRLEQSIRSAAEAHRSAQERP